MTTSSDFGVSCAECGSLCHWACEQVLLVTSDPFVCHVSIIIFLLLFGKSQVFIHMYVYSLILIHKLPLNIDNI